ncbi:MAG: hypothetical protein WCR46_26565 [Deltaproteobacteria bacterium]
MKYSEPRFTKDLDVFIATDQDNANGVYAALKEFGAPLKNLTPDDFAHKGYFYQMGRPPLRIDIMMSIPGIEFDEAWENRESVELSELKILFISELILSEQKKRAEDHKTGLMLINSKKLNNWIHYDKSRIFPQI